MIPPTSFQQGISVACRSVPSGIGPVLFALVCKQAVVNETVEVSNVTHARRWQIQREYQCPRPMGIFRDARNMAGGLSLEVKMEVGPLTSSPIMAACGVGRGRNHSS